MADNVIKHHGIPGMKWGKRNGPPYPLTSGAMSSTEKKWAKGDGKGDGDDPGTGVRRRNYNPRSITTTKRKRANIAKQMSDKELNERIKRLEKETRYLQLEKNLDDLNPLAGKTAASKALAAIGTKVVLPTLTAAFGAYLVNTITQIPNSDGYGALSNETINFIKKAIEKGVLGKK